MVTIDVAHIRAALGIGFEAGTAWFSLDEADVPFAPQKTPGQRAVVLRRWREGPVVHVYARSTTSRYGLVHVRHDHREEFPTCWLAKRARIVLARALPVKRRCLSDESYMCAEPDPAVTTAVMNAYCPP